MADNEKIKVPLEPSDDGTGVSNLWDALDGDVEEILEAEGESDEDAGEAEKSKEEADKKVSKETEPEDETEGEEEEGEPESDDEGDEEGGEDADEDAEDEGKAVQPDAKVYKGVQADGTEVELPDNVVFKVRENGRFRRVTFKELKDNHAGKVAWDEKLEEVNTKRREVEAKLHEHEQELAAVNTYAAEMVQRAKDGDAEGAMEMVGVLANQPNFVKDMYAAFQAHFERMEEMSPEEQENFRLQQQNRSLKRKNERSEKIAKSRETVREVREKVTGFKQRFDISDVEMQEAYRSLVAGGKEEKDLVVEDVVIRVLDTRTLAHIDSLDEELKSGLNDKEKARVWRLVKASEAQGGKELEPEDIAELIGTIVDGRESIGDKAADNLSRKVRKSRRATPKRKKERVEPEFDGSVDDMWDSL